MWQISLRSQYEISFLLSWYFNWWTFFFFLKLLEGIGAIKEADKKKNNYQDLVTTQLSQEFDDDTVG